MLGLGSILAQGANLQRPGSCPLNPNKRVLTKEEAFCKGTDILHPLIL